MTGMVSGARPQLLGFVLVPVVLVLLALDVNPLAPSSVLLMLVCVGVQVSCHFFNSFFDHYFEVDRKQMSGGDRLLVDKHMTSAACLSIALASSGASLVFGFGFLPSWSLADLLELGGGAMWLLGSVVFGALYVPLKRYYCGDVVFLGCFGPGVAQYCAAVFESSRTGAYSALLLPHVLCLEAWYLAGSQRDIPWHNKVKCGTLASCMGSEGTSLIYALTIVLLYLSILQLMLFEGAWYGLCLFSGPLGWDCLNVSMRNDLTGLQYKSWQLHGLVGSLLVLGKVLALTFGTPVDDDQEYFF